MRRTALFLAALSALAAPAARADDLKLKDGATVSGVIVGYEENSFKVKTTYGYAVVQKDQVVSIRITSAAASANSSAPAREDVPPQPAQPPAIPAAANLSSRPAPRGAGAHPATRAPLILPRPIRSSFLFAQSSALPPPPDPGPIREQVAGNRYINDSYGFEMYKPPDWEVLDGARSMLPGAIAAMGTGDETTYLLIGQDPAGKSPAEELNAAETRLRDALDNFRALGERQLTVSGSAALERRFRGSADQHDWSGVVVVVPRGGQLYTIFGMTRADDDLVQIQENVIGRAIASLQFTQ